MSADERRTVLFVCRHGAAKSVLAAEDLRIIAAERGYRIASAAAGVEPSGQVSPAVVQALADEGVDVDRLRPRRVTQAALSSAWRVITFNLDPTELPIAVQGVERWDDVPAVGEDFEGARAAIGSHLERFVEGLGTASGPAGGRHLVEGPDVDDTQQRVGDAAEEKARAAHEQRRPQPE